jgi:NADH-quinone oxidoreductase subunit A
LYFDFANVLVFSVVAIGFVAMNLVVARILRPRSTVERVKYSIYECGEPTVGNAWVRFDIRFYTVALMFVIFDVEIALLFPWAVIFRDLAEQGLGALAFIEAGTFILILMVGLAYVWGRGDIEWTSPVNERGGSGQGVEERLPGTARREPVAAGVESGAADV